MSKLSEITIERKDEWNEIVRSFADYSPFYLAEYASAVMNENNANGAPRLLLYENGADRAVNVVFKRDIAKDPRFSGKIAENNYYDLTSHHAYGGFKGIVSDYERLNAEFTAYCADQRCVSEFTKFDLFSDYYQYYAGQAVALKHEVVRNLTQPMEVIWMDFKHSVRKNVNRARAYGLELIIDRAGAYMDDFLRIYQGTMRRNNAERQYFFSRRFFETVMGMRDEVVMFHAKYNGRIIASELVLYGANNSYSFLGGTESEYFYTRANDYLKYEIIKWSKKMHLQSFVLGGGYGADNSLFEYKLKFAPHGVRDLYVGRSIIDEAAYQKLLNIRCDGDKEMWDKLIESDYFPAYRGGCCYEVTPDACTAIAAAGLIGAGKAA